MRDFEIPGLTKTTVTASSQYLLLPRFHRLANRTTVSLRELDGECFIPYPRTRENCRRPPGPRKPLPKGPLSQRKEQGPKVG